jgi:hypothetical protein
MWRWVQSRTISRKVVEILMSMYLERRMGKPAIMEAYLNNVYWSASYDALSYPFSPRTQLTVLQHTGHTHDLC